MEKFLNYISSPAFYVSIIMLALMFLILRIIKQVLIKRVAYTNKDEQHSKTLAGVVFNVLQYVVIIVAVVIVLQLNGINITSILAGLGIMATIVGLSLQDTLKDIFAGINIYTNNFYKVGDVVKYNGQICEVKYFNARVTKFKDLMQASTFTVCNSNITSIEKIKDDTCTLIRFEPEEDTDKILKCFEEIVPQLNDLYGVREANYTDVMFDNKSNFIILMYKANPRHYYEYYSKVYAICLKYFRKYNLMVDYDDNFKVQFEKLGGQNGTKSKR